VSRGALEAVALEGYHDGTLSREQVGRMLGCRSAKPRSAKRTSCTASRISSRTLSATSALVIVDPDASPLNYLVLIELQDLLPELLDRVLIPEAVHRELQSSGAPDPVKRFLAEALLLNTGRRELTCGNSGVHSEHTRRRQRS
jgi:hypothetical protein